MCRKPLLSPCTATTQVRIKTLLLNAIKMEYNTVTEMELIWLMNVTSGGR
jgi:hypothetical protein